MMGWEGVQDGAHGTGNWERGCRMRGQDAAMGPGSGIECAVCGMQLDGDRLEPWHGARYWAGAGWDRAALCVTGMGLKPTAEHWAHQSGTATPTGKRLCPMGGHRKAVVGAGVGMCCTGCCQSGQGNVSQWAGQGSHSGQGRVPQESPMDRQGAAGRISTVPSPHLPHQPPHLELPPGIELFQALHCLLPVHHGGHGRTLLWGTVESAPGASGH